MKPAYLILAALVLSTPAAAQEGRTILIVPPNMGHAGLAITDTMGTPYELSYSPARIFTVLAEVYKELKIETELRDSAKLEVGNAGFFARGDVAGRRMSAYLECGGGTMGPYADSYKISMTLVSYLKPMGSESTTLRTAFLASVVSLGEGAHRNRAACFTTGELESRIHKAVLKKLTG